jgi:sucrose-6-phosphate hydrolase SacC (GH32 family)
MKTYLTLMNSSLTCSACRAGAGTPSPRWSRWVSLLVLCVAAGLPRLAWADDKPLDLSPLSNPVWTTADNLRDPSVLPTPDGYLIFYSRLTGHNSASPTNWSIASVFTRDFIHFENNHDVSPKGCASPGDVIRWGGRWLLPYQTYPAQPTELVFSESSDLSTWSSPRPFLTAAVQLPWNELHRVIDPTFVLRDGELHCFFVGSRNVTNHSGRVMRANLLGHAVTRDPQLQSWTMLTPDHPLLGISPRAPDGVENVMIFPVGQIWTMIFSEGLVNQHLAIATSADLNHWTVGDPIQLPRQKWMARKYGAPFVWHEQNRWLMLLMGENRTGKTSFGLLTSSDGIHWNLLPERE